MMTYEDALERVLKPLVAVPVVSMSLTDALGCCLAEEVTARVELPGFDTASMDGYAVRASEVPGGGVCLPCCFEVAAGCAADRSLGAGECARILTGAPMPAGSDAVVMQEDTEREVDGRIRFLDGVKPWENVRFRGEDFRVGTRLLAAGQRMGPPQLALAAAAGHAEVRVHRRVRVVVVVCGDELQPPGSPLASGQIHDSNSVLLASLFRSAGAEVVVLPVLPDQLEATMAGLDSAVSRGDLVVTAGGASVGDRDFLRPAWERLGGAAGFFPGGHQARETTVLRIAAGGASRWVAGESGFSLCDGSADGLASPASVAGTDLLGVADYLGHAFGPAFESRESTPLHAGDFG